MSKTTKELILLINSFDGGGAERQFSILADYLPFKAIYCLETDNVYLDGSKHQLNFLSNHDKKTGSIKKYLSTPFYAYKLYKEIKHREHIQILSVLERSHIVCYLLSFFMNIEYVLSFQLSHKSHYNGISGTLLKFLFKKIVKRSLFCIPNSYAGEAEMAQLYDIPAEKIKAIPNGYNFEEIHNRAAQSDQFQFPELLQQKYILCVARFFGQKAQDQLIKAFSQLRATHADIKLVFAGTGEKMEACIQLSLEEKLKTFVIDRQTYTGDYDVYFLGFQRNPLVLMKHAALFAFPTYYEGLPNALIEAMICGAVPIASDCPTGPREIIAPNSDLNTLPTTYELSPYGILVAPFDATTRNPQLAITNWANAIKHLLDNATLCEEIKAHLSARVSNYNMDEIIKKWNVILAEIAS